MVFTNAITRATPRGEAYDCHVWSTAFYVADMVDACNGRACCYSDAMRIIYIVVFSCLLAVQLISVAGAASHISLDKQRILFEQAHQALNAKKMSRYHALYQQLEGYPLRPYLDIWEARKHLKERDDVLVIKVLDKHANIPESIDLRIAWLKQLAKRGQWPRVRYELENHPKLQRYLQTITLLSQWYGDQQKQALEGFSSYWLKHKTTPKTLHVLEKAWLDASHPTKRERWQKIMYLVKHGQWLKAQSLAKGLDKEEQAHLLLWQHVQRQPDQYLEQWAQSDIEPTLKKIVLHDGFRRLSRQGADKAWLQLQKIQSYIDADILRVLQRNIALRAAKQHLPQSADWLASLSITVQNDETRAWQARMFLMQGEQQAALSVIESMPGRQQEESRWLYWKARILENMGYQEIATALDSKLAMGRGYYSFLSAEHLRLPYQMVARSFEVPPSMLAKFKVKPAVIRAGEWVKLGKDKKARREWILALQEADEQTWLVAMHVASHWQWYDQAIRAAWKGGAVDALIQRFPMAHREQVTQAATQSGLDRSVIWGVIRQESAFNAQARSRVGARGLMQLMPKTAKQVARQHHLKINTRGLFKPAKNVRLGALYLADMQQRFGGNLAMALAAYNAGPHRVKQWKKRIASDEATLWVELIPFNETRRYVQQIMAFITVYDWRQHKDSVSLLARMQFLKQKDSEGS